MENKILIRTDWGRESRILEEIETSIEAINTVLKPALEKIGFTLDDSVLSDCLTGGSQLRKDYESRLKKDLSKIGTPSTKRKIEIEATEEFERFENVLINVRKEIKGVNSFITIVDGLAVLTDEARERLIESCKIYLTDPKQIEIHNHLIEACKHLNAVFTNNLPLWWKQIFAWDAKKGFYPNGNIDYSYLGGQNNEF